MPKKFLLYLFRWQLSTPILWLVVRNLGMGMSSTIIANLIGGAIFFWVDIFIFSPKRGQNKGASGNIQKSGSLVVDGVGLECERQKNLLCSSLSRLSPGEEVRFVTDCNHFASGISCACPGTEVKLDNFQEYGDLHMFVFKK